MNIKSWQPQPTSVLCSNHFEANLVDRSGLHAVITPGAIPTKFDTSFQENIVSTPSLKNPLKRNACGDPVTRDMQNVEPSSSSNSTATPGLEVVKCVPGNQVLRNVQNLLPTTSSATLHYVCPSSPADIAGLQPGDIVARLSDKLATELSHETAIQIVAEAVGSLSFGICRGLYDPVVDDYEPMYETIDRADSDLRSEPTEEYIRDIERKSSLLASAIDQTIKSIEEYKEEVGIDTKKAVQDEKTGKTPSKCVTIGENTTITNGFSHTNGVTNGHDTENKNSESKMKEEWKEIDLQITENNGNVKELSQGEGKRETDVLPGFKPVVFNPEAFQAKLYEEVIRGTCETETKEVKVYVDEAGEPLGTIKGIVDGLELAVVDEEVAKELGKPGLTEDTIAVLISGESEMLREAHVMGLSRVITSHMTRADDSSVDFQKIKPLVESLKDSEVLKALNEEILREKEAKKKEEKKWTTFLQKPKRPVPKAKFGYYGYVEQDEDEIEEPYKVKIVKQPKPKVAPDYKPEDFDTGPLPWEQRALIEPVPSPVPPEDPILVPEEVPEFLEALDTLPESEVPDLEDTGIPLPPTPPLEDPLPPPEDPLPPELPPEVPPELPPPEAEEPPAMHVAQNQMSEQLVNTVRSMVDPNAPLEQQLAQMRAQLSALAQLPCVIQQSLEMLTKQLSTLNHQNNQMNYEPQKNTESRQEYQENSMETIQEYQIEESQTNGVAENNHEAVTIEEVQLQQKPVLTEEEYAMLKREEEAMVEQQRRNEKEQEKARLEHESRQVKQRATPRVGKPKRMFGPPNPEDRPLVLPGGRRWRGPKDAITEQMIDETLQAQSEILQGKVMGINFMKYEKPPVKLDHLKESATYKMIHNLEEVPMKRVELRTPVLAEADYRERCRSATPRIQTNGHM